MPGNGCGQDSTSHDQDGCVKLWNFSSGQQFCSWYCFACIFETLKQIHNPHTEFAGVCRVDIPFGIACCFPLPKVGRKVGGTAALLVSLGCVHLLCGSPQRFGARALLQTSSSLALSLSLSRSLSLSLCRKHSFTFAALVRQRLVIVIGLTQKQRRTSTMDIVLHIAESPRRACSGLLWAQEGPNTFVVGLAWDRQPT